MADEQPGQPERQPDQPGREPVGPSPARAPGGTRPSVEERVTAIAKMMREGEWVSGKSDKLLSALWGYDRNTVRRAAAEASRRVRHERNLDATSERHTVLDLLDEAAEMARDDGGAKGAKAMQAIAKTRAEVAGLLHRGEGRSVNVTTNVLQGAAPGQLPVPAWRGALEQKAAETRQLVEAPPAEEGDDDA